MSLEDHRKLRMRDVLFRFPETQLIFNWSTWKSKQVNADGRKRIEDHLGEVLSQDVSSLLLNCNLFFNVKSDGETEEPVYLAKLTSEFFPWVLFTFLVIGNTIQVQPLSMTTKAMMDDWILKDNSLVRIKTIYSREEWVLILE